MIGAALKRSSLGDKYIPAVLGVTGVILCVLWVASNSAFDGWQSVMTALFTAIVQGVLVAGASVYVNQVIKQAGKEE